MIKNALRQFFTYGAGNIAQSALNLILLPLFLRLFEPAQYGVISLLLVTSSFLAAFASLGIGTGLFRLYYEAKPGERKKLVGTTWLWLLFTATLGLIVLSTQAPHLSKLLFHVENYSHSIVLLGAFFFFSFIGDMPFSIFRIEQKASYYVGFSLLRFIIDFALKLSFIAFLGRGINGYFEAGILAYIITLCLMVPFILKYVSFSLNSSYLKQLLRLGFPYVFSGFAVWILTVSDRYILNQFKGAAEVGIYSLGYSFANIFDTLLTAPSALFWAPFFFSYAAERSAEDTKRLLNKSLIYFLLVGGMLYLIISLGAGDLLRALTFLFAAKPEYHQATTFVPVLTLGLFFYLLSRQATNAMLMAKKPEYGAIAVSIAAAVNLGLNLILIPRFGVWGAAIDAVIAYALIDLLSYWWAQRIWHVNYDWKIVVKAFLFMAIAFIIGWNIKIEYSWASLISRLAAALGIFGLLSWFFILTTEERDMFHAYLAEARGKVAKILRRSSLP